MGKIEISSFFGVWRNADQEDLPDGYFSELKDLIGRNGKLEKTFDFGGATADITIPSGYTVYGLATFIHDELTNDYSYILVLINATFQVKIYVYSGTVWYELSDGSGMNVTYGTYYHKKDRNPIIQTHDAIRILPGNVSKAYSTNESKGIWLGYLNRNYFWNSAIKTIDGFKAYDTCLEQSAFSLLSVLTDNSETAGDLPADTYYYKIVPVFDGVQEALLPDSFKSIAAIVNKVVRLQYTFGSISTAFNGRLTGFNIYRASDTDSAYYKILEVSTLDTDPTLIYSAIALVGYGLYVKEKYWDDDDYQSKHAIIDGLLYDITTNTADVCTVNLEGASTNPVVDGYEIWGGKWAIIDSNLFTANCGSDFEVDNFADWALTDAVISRGTEKYYGTYGGKVKLDAATAEGSVASPAFNCLEETEYYISGVIKCETGADGIAIYAKDDIAGTATLIAGTASTSFALLSGTYTTSTGASTITIYIIVYDASVSQKSGYIDMLYLGKYQDSGDDDGYAGINTVISDDFSLGVEDHLEDYRILANDSDGNYSPTATLRKRIINNVNKAVRADSDFSATALGYPDKAYICKNYLWQEGGVHASGKVDLWVYDDGLLDAPATTDKHPLLNEVSIKVNGELAMLYKGRLWQAVLVLDPGGEGEEHTEWIGYSYLTSTGDPCYDINPVSNIYPLPDREGGKITGWAAGFDSIFIFKAHSIFRLVISDITDPTSWVLKESNFDVGNLAKQGVVTVGNTTYFCAYDGIHTLDPNVGAETSQSPTLRDIITEPIRDIYIALTDDQKAAIQGEYDQINREIIWRFTSASIWAYHTDTQQWRQKDTNQVIDLMGYDENSNILVYNNTDKKVYNIDTNGAVGIALRTKDYQISDDDKVVVRFITVVYKSVTALTLNFYTDNDDSTVRATATLPVSTTITQLTVAIRYYCNRFNVEIIDEVNSTTDTQINKLIIEHGD